MDYTPNALLANSAGELPIQSQFQEPTSDPDVTTVKFVAHFPIPDGGVLVDSSDWIIPTDLVSKAVDAPGRCFRRGTVAITFIQDEQLPVNAVPHVQTPAVKLHLEGRDDNTSTVYVGLAVVTGRPVNHLGGPPPT